MLSGSLASNFYGVARATQDADIVVELDRVPLDDFSRRLGAGFEVDRQVAFETVTASHRLLIRARESVTPCRETLLVSLPFDRARFSAEKR